MASPQAKASAMVAWMKMARKIHLPVVVAMSGTTRRKRKSGNNMSAERKTGAQPNGCVPVYK